MEICISTNGYKVISHGDVLLYDGNSEMKMDVTADNNFKFTILIKFIQSENGKTGLDKKTDQNTLIFECTNFQTMGTGTTSPIPIATIDGKGWFLHFWAYKASDNSPRRVEYTILEKE